MAEDLGRRGMDVLMFLAHRDAGGGGAPSLREISSAVGFKSSRSAYVYLQKLEEHGYVEREGGRARGIRLTARGRGAAMQNMPMLGNIAAGRGMEAVEAREDAYSLYEELFSAQSGAGRYLLRVVGRSMVEAGIEDGDLLVVEEEDSPPDGAVVVALVEGGEEVTVKRLYREGDSVRLKSESELHEDIVVPAESVLIQGQVVYVIHQPRT